MFRSPFDTQGRQMRQSQVVKGHRFVCWSRSFNKNISEKVLTKVNLKCPLEIFPLPEALFNFPALCKVPKWDACRHLWITV